MGFMFCDLHVSLNNPSSGDINSSNLPCSLQQLMSFTVERSGSEFFSLRVVPF